MSRGPAITVARFPEHVAARLVAHESCTDANTRANIRRKLRQTARKLGIAPPTWALAIEYKGAEQARRSSKSSRFRTLRKRAPATCPAIMVLARGEVARPFEIDPRLVAWRQRTPFGIVHVRGDGSVTLCVPVSLDVTERREFASVAEACAAVTERAA